MATKILLVDDDDAIAFAMRRYFSLRGFEVDCAFELEEALSMISMQRYAAVLADLRLTGVDGAEGLELVSRLRTLAPGTKAVLLTAYGSPELDDEAARRGAHAVVRKPAPLPVLERLLRNLLGEA